MGIISQIRRGVAAVRQLRGTPLPDGEPELAAFSAAIPVGPSGAPLWQIDVQITTEPHADGERLRLRARIQTNLASALKPALGAPAVFSDSRALTVAERTGSLVQRTANRVLALPAVRAFAEPLLSNDFNTWIEIQASTASLDGGARELIPQSDKLAALGIQPRLAGDQPVAETWSGQAADGFAQVSLLQIDKRHLPPGLAQRMGDKPFQLAAAIVNTAQQK
ncbi:hypothetical protein D0B54_22130 [Solimonas sp. K1W22B-7]|uniref:hypothetical protein n=1 Tax=Solimonas sp. K1W22B-7 TaxID=2303331 RepID=UPI000E32F9B8|nr:hypothetical protein [Solimonas sp. K1W22B-7]AXQ31212.1 hypothetical protein D0B54_22130 [Solimonas sp. K1W22B-7]